MELGARFCAIISAPHDHDVVLCSPNFTPHQSKRRSSPKRFVFWGEQADHSNRSQSRKRRDKDDTEKKWTNIGVVTESLPIGMFRVGLVNMVEKKIVRVNDAKILGYVSGRIRTNHVRMVPGDTVEIEISSYDTKKGWIVYRLSWRDLERMTGARDDFEEDG